MSIEKHKDSDYLLFLRSSRSSDSAELRLAYSLGEIYDIGYTHCWVCGRGKGSIIFEDVETYKDHYEAAHYDKKYFYSSDYLDDYVAIPVSISKMLGLFDQFIIFFRFDKLRKTKRKNHSPNFHASFGGCITRIMKEYNIPMKFFTHFIGMSNAVFERYTTAYYKSLPEKDRPSWMKNFL